MPRTHAVPTAGTYQFQPAETQIQFTTRHLYGFGRVSGSFDLVGGEIVVADPPSSSKVVFSVGSASFSTGDARRDKHVRSPTFLDSEAHPLITFVSDSVTQTERAWDAHGHLTVQGATQPLTVKGQIATAGEELTIHATAAVDRYHHGVARLKGMAARWLNFEVTARAVRQET